RLLAVDDERRPEPLGELRSRDSAEGELAAFDTSRRRKEIEHPRILPGTVFTVCSSCLHESGDERGAAADVLVEPLAERLFCTPKRMSEAMDRYEAGAIEEKWQRVWADAKAFEVSNDPIEPKSYVLEMLPYPSGTLHMGHMLVYTIGDVVTRFRARN